MIEVMVNAEAKQLAAGTTLQQALEQWQANAERMACAINGEFTPRSQYASTQLQHGDQLDLVRPIGGG